MILVISPKKVYASERLLEEADNLGIGLEIISAENVTSRINIAKYSCLYVRNPYTNKKAHNLPKIIDLAKKFKLKRKKVVDQVIAEGELGQGKWSDYQRLLIAGVSIPKTELLPNYSLLTTNYSPLILKWTYGFKGKHTFFVKNQAGFNIIKKKYPVNELLVQQFINAEYEYKVITVGYKALPVILRFGIDSVTHRPDFKNFDVLNAADINIWNVITVAEQASKVLKRELAKVDILEDKGKFYVLEVNRFPGLKSFENLTKFNAAKEFLLYLQK